MIAPVVIETADAEPLRAVLDNHVQHLRDLAEGERESGTALAQEDSSVLYVELAQAVRCVVIPPACSEGRAALGVIDPEYLAFMLDHQIRTDLDDAGSAALERVAASVAVLRQLA